MIVIITPVSGPAFVGQLAGIQKLCEYDIVPNIILGSSGGNVANYISAMADWKWNKIEIIASKISSTLLFLPWSSVTAISSVLGFFKGSAFNYGTGAKKLLQANCEKEILNKYELWTGTFNKVSDKCRLFCNLSKDKCKLKEEDMDYDLFQMMNCGYLDNDIDCITKVISSSATIPSVSPPQKYEGELYIDGGMCSASPLPMMKDCIIKNIEKTNENLHLFLISPTNLENIQDSKCDGNLLQNLSEASDMFIKYQALMDRSQTLELIKYRGKLMKYKCQATTKNMKKIMKIISLVKYSMVEIYPLHRIEVNMTSFDGEDVVKTMKEAYDILHCRIWWIENESSKEEIEKLITPAK